MLKKSDSNDELKFIYMIYVLFTFNIFGASWKTILWINHFCSWKVFFINLINYCFNIITEIILITWWNESKTIEKNMRCFCFTCLKSSNLRNETLLTNKEWDLNFLSMVEIISGKIILFYSLRSSCIIFCNCFLCWRIELISFFYDMWSEVLNRQTLFYFAVTSNCWLVVTLWEASFTSNKSV